MKAALHADASAITSGYLKALPCLSIYDLGFGERVFTAGWKRGSTGITGYVALLYVMLNQCPSIPEGSSFLD